IYHTSCQYGFWHGQNAGRLGNDCSPIFTTTGPVLIAYLASHLRRENFIALRAFIYKASRASKKVGCKNGIKT
ncbi:MAG TPA: hypothetical protein PKL42_05390, partial [Methylotenera sp.]|nr:hypothetical protein [Methylotenera sp.]